MLQSSTPTPTPAACTVGLITFSGTGITDLIADAVATGVRRCPGITLWRHSIQGSAITEGRWHDAEAVAGMEACETLILGCPTYFGGIPAQMKALLDAMGEPFFRRRWKDRLAGGFTVSGDASGDKAFTLIGLCVVAMQQGMLWVGQDLLATANDNRHGCYLGLGLQAPPRGEGFPTGDLATAQAFGRRMAEATRRWHRGGGHVVP